MAWALVSPYQAMLIDEDSVTKNDTGISRLECGNRAIEASDKKDIPVSDTVSFHLGSSTFSNLRCRDTSTPIRHLM